MGDAETEYYWDEDSQCYYCWDEESQSYYMYAEEAELVDGAAVEPEAPLPAAADTTEVCPQESLNTSASEESIEAGVSGFESLAPPTAPGRRVSFPVDNEPSEEQALFRRPERGVSRKLSFRAHGGLAGCLQQAATERLSRGDTMVLSDEEIRRNSQLQLARDMAALFSGNPSRRNDDGDNEGATGSAGYCSTTSDGKMLKGDAATDARNRRRSTTSVRFGTQEYSDPAFQDRLEAMLGSSVRK